MKDKHGRAMTPDFWKSRQILSLANSKGISIGTLMQRYKRYGWKGAGVAAFFDFLIKKGTLNSNFLKKKLSEAGK